MYGANNGGGQMGKDGAEQVRQFFSNLPYAQTLRLDLQELGAGWAVMVLPYHEDLIGDPATGVVHAGAVSALLDTTCGAAVASHPDTGAVTGFEALALAVRRAPGRRSKTEEQSIC